ncbi:MAG TPA: precorrin-6y C5,15-methyltransferase (decarboxylating) subunit CbiE [Solirubrobacterales bacterium]|nr:precorrin-6y C5,15-methyltransferase (decarboxylating) subunit CbiE [Solirubrobacterales bacterium]
MTVVGIGADGWTGLGEGARAALRDAGVVVGSRRQLELLPGELAAERRALPSPLEPFLDELAATDTEGICVLASGDPMLHGIGASLARRVEAGRLRVHPHPSAFALACARLGWPAAEVELVSAVGRPVAVVARLLQPGRRLVAYVTGAEGARSLARMVTDRGFGPSRLTVLERLGGPEERLIESSAEAFDADADPLHVVALEVRAAVGVLARGLAPGLPDDAFENDGQLTKRHVRAVTLAALAPMPHSLLWDIGAGSGSIAVEWLRSEATATAVAVERDPARAARVARNAEALGVPDRLEVVPLAAPEALVGLDVPSAVFIGGGLTEPGLLDACWAALRPGGRLVANAVTLEGERTLGTIQEEYGGALTRIEIAHARPLGGFTGWRAQMPVVQWEARKP